MMIEFRLEKQKNLLKKIEQYNNHNILYQVEYDDDGFIINVTTEVKQKEEKNDEEFDLPMPTYCLEEKKYNARVYGAMILKSNRTIFEQHRYLYKNKLDIDNLAQELNIPRSTLYRNIKELEKINCNILSVESTKQGIVYKFHYGQINEETGNLNKYITINNNMLRKLVNAFNSDAIKVYCILKYSTNEIDFKPISNKYLAEAIGLSAKSNNNLKKITDIIDVLEVGGYIETKKDNIFIINNETGKKTPKISKCYRLKSYDEWNDTYTKNKSKSY